MEFVYAIGIFLHGTTCASCNDLEIKSDLTLARKLLIQNGLDRKTTLKAIILYAKNIVGKLVDMRHSPA